MSKKFWVIMGILAIGFIFGLFYKYWIPSAGTHTGVVTATETNTFIWSTKAAYFKTDVRSSQEDVYCVADKVVFERLQEFQKSQEIVTIEFEHGWLTPKWECDIGISIITNVRK